MNANIKKPTQMVRAGLPASVYRPETSDESQRVIEDAVEMGYQILRNGGYQECNARALTDNIWCGASGMLMFTIGVREIGDE
jgi:hypothetical protein